MAGQQTYRERNTSPEDEVETDIPTVEVSDEATAEKTDEVVGEVDDILEANEKLMAGIDLEGILADLDAEFGDLTTAQKDVDSFVQHNGE